MKKKLLSLLLALLALTTTALAAQYADAGGTVRDEDAPADADETAYYETDPLPPLGNPFNLRWDTETSEASGSQNGRARWETSGPFQGKARISYYRVGEPESAVTRVTVHYSANHPNSFSNTRFLYTAGRFSSGDYYFTVKNLGDGITYSDSAEVSSLDMPDGAGIYHYVDPGEETALTAPAQVRWEWPAAVWEDRQDEDERMLTYEINYGYSETSVQDPAGIFMIGGSSFSQSGEEDSWLQDRLISENGAGWYYFRVRPISRDIERWRNGQWSPWSEGYNLLEASQKITDSLNAIDKSAPAEDVRSQVQALNKTELLNALTADIQGAETGTEAALAALENALGGPARPAVAPELADTFNADGVSIMGAALNNATGDPVLNIGRPKQENHVRDELYSSTLAVDFSMELENVEDSHDLAVPVKVTLPVPANINPDFLAVLHYKADGSFEEVLHTVFEKDGRWYASFVLTGFSDFTLTQTVSREGPPALQTAPDGRWQAVNVPEGARLLLARYEEGRLRSAEELSALSGTLEGSGKLFLLDREGRPLCPAASL